MIPVMNDLSVRPVGAISDEDAYTTAEFLNNLLANEFALFSKTLNFHWNIVGSHFLTVHKFLEQNYKELLEFIDQIAERIRILGEIPKSTVQDSTRAMMIKENDGGGMNWREMVSELLKDHQMIQNSIKYYLKEEQMKNDPGSVGVLNDVILMHEKCSWKLKSELSFPDQ